MDMVKRMEASLSQMGRTAKLQAPTQTRSGRIPKEWVKFTGDPATIVKEYQDYERQAYRANFRTWREFFDQFEECIQKDSRFDKVYIPFREEDDFQRVKKVAIARADDQLWLTLYTQTQQYQYLRAQIDPDAPRQEAEAEWVKALESIPHGDYTWGTLDTLENRLRTARAMRKMVGSFDPTDPEHRRKELEELKRYSRVGTKIYRAIYGENRIPVDTYEQWLKNMEYERRLLRPPEAKPKLENIVLTTDQ